MANWIKSKITLALLVATPWLTVLDAVAQDLSPHEFSVWGGAGNASLNIKKQTGSASGGIGFNMGVGYNFNFSEQWSVGTGVEIATLGSELKVRDVGETYITNSASVTYRMGEMKEKVTINQMNIPLMVQYLSKGSEHKFYAAMGAKIGIPVTKKTKSDATTFATKVTGAGINILDENMARPSQETDLELKTATMLALELGIKWSLGSNSSLYTGAYMDYGLNNILKPEAARRLIDYTGTGDNNGFEHNSLFNASYEDAETGESKYFVSRMIPMTIGFKVRWSYQAGGNGRTKTYKRGRGRESARDKYMNNEVIKGVFDNMSPADIQKRVDKKLEDVKRNSAE